MDTKLDRKLPKELLNSILHAAEINYDNNENEIKKLSEKDAYMLAFVNGYETAWAIYTDEDEEALRKYGKIEITEDGEQW